MRRHHHHHRPFHRHGDPLEGHSHASPPPFSRVGAYVTWRLHRVIFFWFGGAMLIASFVVSGGSRLIQTGVPKPVVIGLGLLTLWGLTGRLARRITRPIGELVRVADAFGSGDLGARVNLGRARHGEANAIGRVFNGMADRIEKQLADQRALLATVSHELKTPLSRIRLLSEFVREGLASRAEEGDRERALRKLSDIESEVAELDALVGDLLANSRIDFATMAKGDLPPAEIAARALEAANLDGSLLEVAEGVTPFRGDPTLAVRAIVNLLENARKHAGGVTSLRVYMHNAYVVFEVRDEGAGVPEGIDLFAPFQRQSADASSTGLGLSLVKRIAQAHGGFAEAENVTPRGSAFRVGFSSLGT
ncbi:MAG: HAMP domain-containing sensor histidine kinase [Polyangiaceae bacterium]